MKWVVKEMTSSQLDAAAVLEQRCFSIPWSRDALESALDGPYAHFLCALEAQSSSLLGYIGAQAVCGEASILNLAVSPDARRCGIGRALLAAMLSSLPAACTVYLEVRESNLPARALYASQGFTQAGRRKGYYTQPAEDALLMSLTLPSLPKKSL